MPERSDRPAEVAADMTIPLLHESVGARLRDTAARFPERDALAWEDGTANGAATGVATGRLRYAVLLRECERVAAWLMRRVRPGERVVIWSRNSLEWILLEYGCALAGAVVVAWNTAWTDAECAHARDLVPPRLVFAGCDTRGGDLLARAERLCSSGQVLSLDRLRDVVADAPLPPVWPSVAPEAPFLLQFTSGTTGRPKAAVLTHLAALNAAWLRARLYGAGEDEVWLNPVPMTHVGGAISMLLGAMVTGGTYVLMPRFEAAAFARLVDACGATRIGGVPTMLLAALDLPGWRPGPTVRSIGLGGTQVPASLIERLRTAFGAPVLVAYGQSECPFATSTVAVDPPWAVVETVGRAAPHVALRICDPEDGRLLAVGQVGEIRLRAPVMLQGYCQAEGAAATPFDGDGYLRTGDLGSLDGHGYVRIHGRARDVIIRGGENIYPAEVEDALLRHAEVAQVAVIGIADARWGQRVAAVVVLRDGATVAPAALEALASERLAHFKVPRHWRFVAALPMTASGKVRKVELDALFDGDAR